MSFLIGGGMANTFFKAQGYPVADSLVEDEEALETAKELLAEGGTKLRLPVDVTIADKFDAEAAFKTMDMAAIPDGWRILDIGPKTMEAYDKALKVLVLWFGMVRWVCSNSRTLPKVPTRSPNLLRNAALSVLLAAAILWRLYKCSGLADKITHISTGGGASLEMLEGLVLPGLAALQDK